jgi:sugar-phosphatase
MPAPLVADALLFDLDGVLVDSMPSVVRAWSAWARRVGLEPAEVLATVHGRRAVDTIRALRPGLDPDEELAGLVADETTDNADVVEIAGASALVSALPAGSWAIVTSGLRAVATARLVTAGVPIPPVMVTAESIVQGKPDPECYLRGAAELGLAPGRCVVVEDAPAGAAAARAAGMRLIGVTSTHDAAALEPADLIVPDLAHLHVAVENGAGRPRLEIASRR